ncbi:MAG TPA: UDP-N-acetylmuramate dehydrogenase [Verrucomicrobiae bacterium]|nr:UDP-N-acetylmuramate dehydrogenase [Verrucomicrobiae bacterium]
MTANILEMPTQSKIVFAAELESDVSKATVIRRNEPLAKRTTLRVGGPADYYVEPVNEADLAAVLKLCRRREMPFFILGRGSNLLIRDRGIRGVVICLAQPAFSEIEINGDKMRCGAGVKLKNVSVEARRNGLSGVEFLEGIPGNVGGALRMNAGAMGGQTFDAIESVRLMNFEGDVSEIPREKMQVAYRGCATLRDHVALAAVFKCSASSREEIEKRMKSFSEKRWDSQPAAPSAGCIFKNPGTIPAGKLMDELGLKGTRIGGAVVSAEHGNFIINDGKATARDVLELIEILKAKAKAERGIELHTEVEIIGEA